MNASSLSTLEAQRLHYAEVRKRLYGKPAGRRVEKVTIAPPAETAQANEEPRCVSLSKKEIMAVSVDKREPNLWERYPRIEFNAHVIAYRRYLLIQEMDEGENDRNPIVERRFVSDIVREVLTAFPGVSVEDLKGSHRNRYIVKARHRAMYEVYMQRRDMSYPAIGRWFGGRDHTTILHAVKKVAAMKGQII
jgi:hypothetical protein